MSHLVPIAPLPSGASNLSPTDESLARTTIFSLVNRYAVLARPDIDHAALMSPIFEPDALIHFAADGREFRPADLGQLTQGPDKPVLLIHHLTSTDVQFVSADEANVQGFVLASTDVKCVDHWGMWEFVVKRQRDGGWLIGRLVIRAMGMDPEGWLMGVVRKHAPAT